MVRINPRIFDWMVSGNISWKEQVLRKRFRNEIGEGINWESDWFLLFVDLEWRNCSNCCFTNVLRCRRGMSAFMREDKSSNFVAFPITSKIESSMFMMPWDSPEVLLPRAAFGPVVRQSTLELLLFTVSKCRCFWFQTVGREKVMANYRAIRS